MTVNQRVFDTALEKKSICGRAIGMNTANGATQLFLVHPDGTLYAATATSYKSVNIKNSTDNGFTWTKDVETAPNARGYDYAEGIPHAIFKDDAGYFWIYCFQRVLYFYDSAAEVTDGFYGEVSVKYGTYLDLWDSSFFSSTGDAEPLVYCTYLTYTDRCMGIVGLDLSRNIYNVLQDYTKYTGLMWCPGLLASKSKEDKVHILGVTAEPTDVLTYTPFYKKHGSGTGHFSGIYEIASGVASSGDSSWIDLAIDVDSDDNIGIVYGQRDSIPGTTITGWYAISNDAGVTWTNIYNDPPAGYSGYIDPETLKVTTIADIIGGASGSFLISNVYMQNGSGTLFVKEITSAVTESGDSASLVPWRRVNSVDGKVIGAKFFKYMDETTPHFGDKSSIRMAYQLGEMNSKYGQDTITSRVFHERLSNLAYPVEYTGVAFTKDNYDYYASGYIDANTQMYIDKINELGMDYSFSRYDPIEDSTVGNRGAYGAPTTFESEACIDPGSYGFSTVARNNADFKEYMERDVRKIFYKPNLYLEREFVLNKGGYLKRTVWTVRIMGNDYEIAQIVPRWLDGNIVYYEANLYVIGPSNDPFSKVILPSET